MIKKDAAWRRSMAKLQVLPERLRLAHNAAALQEAHLFRTKVLRAFKTGGRSNGAAWEPLRPSTIAGKGSSKPLIDRGDLRDSIVVVPQGARVFAGVSSKARNKSGQRLVDIADVHEHGVVFALRVTKKMHAYVMARMAELGGGGKKGSGNFRPGAIIVIRIPERSFLRATAEAHFTPPKVAARVQARMVKYLGLGGAKTKIKVNPSPKDGD